MTAGPRCFYIITLPEPALQSRLCDIFSVATGSGSVLCEFAEHVKSLRDFNAVLDQVFMDERGANSSFEAPVAALSV